MGLDAKSDATSPEVDSAPTLSSDESIQDSSAAPEMEQQAQVLARIETQLAEAAQTPPLTAKELHAHRQRMKEHLEGAIRIIVKNFQEKLVDSHSQLAKRVEQSVARSQADLEQLLESRFTNIEKTLAPEETEEEEPLTGSADWERAVLGEYLYEDPELVDERHELIQGVLAGDKNARALVGELMLVQVASKDDLAQQAKAVGEAFYRWRPKSEDTNTPMEQALAAVLEKQFEVLNLRNRIELVRPGDQYDRQRHNANGPGVEITLVRGWVVLRENGKPATKANVNVQ